MPQFSLRSLLLASLLAWVIGPAALSAWWTWTNTALSAEAQATQALREATRQAKLALDAHLSGAHRALDGLIPESRTTQYSSASLSWVADPALFAPMAFALARASSDLRFIYYRAPDGRLHGVENAAEGFRFEGSAAVDGGARGIVLFPPYGALKLPSAGGESPDPRGQSWHGKAASATGRLFLPAVIYPSSKQLVLPLSQPLKNAAGALTGVIGVDLSLARLPALLRQTVGGPAVTLFLVDEQGMLMASSDEASASGLSAPSTANAANATPAAKPPSSSALAKPAFNNAYSGSPVVRASYKALEKDMPLLQGGTTGAARALEFQMPEGEFMALPIRVGHESGLKWTLVAAAPKHHFSAGHGNAMWFSAAWAALALAAFLTTLWVSGHFERCFAWARRTAEQLAHGVQGVRPATLIREFHQLAASLRTTGTLLHGLRPQATQQAQLPAARCHEETRALHELQAVLAEQNTELAIAREQAMVAMRSKAAFLTVISHELRTPLNGVMGMSKLLANTALNTEQRDYLDSLFISGHHLQAVVDEILEFSRSEASDIVLQIAPFDVQVVVQQACADAARSAKVKGLKLLVDVPATVRRGDGTEVPWLVLGDADRLEQVIRELVANAVKFTDKGRVLVQARPLQSARSDDVPMLEVRVIDSGLGIALDESSTNAFNAFAQLEPSFNRRQGGGGLGLATCRRLVELMGGTIDLQSEPGNGSTFRFTALAPWAAPTEPARTVPVLEPQQADMFTPKVNSKVRVLVVDDNAINLKVACAMLTKFGYETLTANSGQDAIDQVAALALRGEKLGAVLMDVHMPGLDGVQACRAILRMQGDNAPPIMALTAGHSQDDRQRCLDAGMVEYLTKPLQMAALLEALDRWAGRRSPAPLAQPMPHKLDVGLPVPSVPGAPAQLTPATQPVQPAPPRQAMPSTPVGAVKTPDVGAAANTSAGKPQHSGAPELLDFSRLQEFKQFDDPDLSMTREVIQLLISEVPAKLAAMDAAILQNDIQRLRAAAHFLRGATGNVGAVALQQLCAELERGTLESKAVPANAASTLVALRIAWNRTLPLLKNWR